MASDKELQLCEQISKLRKRAVSLGCDSAKVDGAITRTVKHYRSSRRWGCCRVCLAACAVLVLVGAVFYKLQPSQARLFLATRSYLYIFRPLRFLALPFLHRWSWLTNYYRAECLVTNPYYEREVSGDDSNVMDVNCACEGVEGPKTTEVQEIFRSEQLLVGGNPIIAERTFPSTFQKRGMDFREFLSWFERNIDAFEMSNCGLLAFGQSSTIDFPVTVGDMMKIAKGTKSSSSYMAASWLLCAGSNGKELVEKVAPVEKLKPALDAGLIVGKEPSLLMIVRHKNFSTFKTAPIDGFMPPRNSLAVLVQLVGMERVRLIPTNCVHCQAKNFDLKAGQTLFYNTSVWLQDLLVHGVAGVSLAYSASYVWPETDDDSVD